MTAQAFSIEDQINCVRREIGFRKRAYPRFIEREKMTQGKADREIATMEAVLATLEALPKTQGTML